MYRFTFTYPRYYSVNDFDDVNFQRDKWCRQHESYVWLVWQCDSKYCTLIYEWELIRKALYSNVPNFQRLGW